MPEQRKRADITYNSSHNPHNDHWGSRRRFIKTGLLAIAACSLPLPIQALAAHLPDKRRLQLYNTHTNEKLNICYYENGRYIPDALSGISELLRDHRTGDVKPIAPDLLDLLSAIGKRVGDSPPFHIISGYRSPVTNAMLRRKSNGVAKKSFHMMGRAVDIRIPSMRTARLREVAKKLRAGGVGYYAKSDFVHVDLGPVRHW
ncbi:MAG: DUF882 domain-containing protein [Desulfobacterales bacterium]